MRVYQVLVLAALFAVPSMRAAAENSKAPLPDIQQLMREVIDHQKQLDHVRENYTYTSLVTSDDIDADGKVKKSESHEYDEFFVNGHLIGREVKKNGQGLSAHDEQKETERVTKLVEKAQKIPSGQPLEGQAVSIGRLLEIMEVRNPRREMFHGRSAIAFDFVGRKDVKTHGLAEDASKKLQGTLHIDEADRQIAHLDVSFIDNFRVGAGLLATVQKGSRFSFDQAPVNGELWLPVGGEGTMAARVLLLKGIREHFTERDYDYKRFRVEAQQSKEARVTPQIKP